jgi:hypothetical protein
MVEMMLDFGRASSILLANGAILPPNDELQGRPDVVGLPSLNDSFFASGVPE